MIINKNSLNGSYVYLVSESEPCGKVNGLYFSAKTGRIEAISVESLSLIPITKIVEISSVHKITKEKIVLKQESHSTEPVSKNSELISYNDILGVRLKKHRINRIKDVNFNVETGEILEFTVKSGPFSKKKSLKTDEIQIKNGIVYIK